MQRVFRIPTPDKHVIHGTLDTGEIRSDRLIVFVHGLTGFKNEHIFFNAAKFFPANGFDTFRFDLYSGEKGGRTMTECGLATHASDIDMVVRYFRRKYKLIFLVGHSFGGPAILSSDTFQTDGLVLWDASARRKNASGFEEHLVYVRSLKAYVLSWGTETLMGKAMYEEWKRFPEPAVVMRKIKAPVKIIVAGKGSLKDGGKQYFRHAQTPKAFAVIRGAGHTFDEPGAEEKLFTETLDWVRKLS